MSTYDDMPDGPGAFFWGVIITLVILILSMSLCGCEPLEEPVDGLKSEEGIGNVNFMVTFPDFSDTVITITY